MHCFNILLLLAVCRPSFGRVPENVVIENVERHSGQDEPHVVPLRPGRTRPYTEAARLTGLFRERLRNAVGSAKTIRRRQVKYEADKYENPESCEQGSNHLASCIRTYVTDTRHTITP
ncbi:unnamed protein product [Heterobilharzia americana]|nr:unnamed protein product [Heterobilharzia americana]